MLKFSRFAVIALLTFALLLAIPKQARKFLVERNAAPFILYSSSLKTFLLNAPGEGKEKGKRIMTDLKGNTYTRRSYEEALPLFFYKDLASWGVLPSTIDGVRVTLRRAAESKQVIGIKPRYIDTPEVGLYPLFESASGFSQLLNPDAMFRLTHKMEFLDTESNQVDEERSTLFTQALKSEGFQFPATGVYGNPEPKKPFDEGYFVIDRLGALFHMKMVKGRPWVQSTGIAPESGIRYMSMSESNRREFYGFMVTGDGKAHLVSWKTYKLVTLPLDHYDPDTMSLTLYCDLLKRTILVADKEAIYATVTDRHYNVTDRYVHSLKKSSGSETMKKLFPLQIRKSSPYSAYAQMNFIWSGKAWLVSFLSASILLFVRWRQKALLRHPEDILVVLVTGVCGLLATLLVDGLPQDQRG